MPSPPWLDPGVHLTKMMDGRAKPGHDRMCAQLQIDKVATGSYFVVMRKIGIKALKNDLSKYIRAAAAGETVLVTDRGQVVAEISPPRISDDPFESNPLLSEDVRRGRIAPATNPDYTPGLKIRVAPSNSIVRELRDDRDMR